MEVPIISISAGGDFADGGEAGGAARSAGNTDAFDFALKTNNVDQLKIEGNHASAKGVVTMPNQSACLATVTSQSVTNDVTTKIQFATEDYDVLGEYDNATNYRFTAKLAGKYLVMVFVECQSLAADKACDVYIYKNGSVLRVLSQLSTGTADASCLVMATDLVATDYIEGFFRQADTTSRTLSSQSFLSIHKVA